MQVELHVTEGLAKGQHFTFDTPDCFLVGRTHDAHISLPDDPYLSRQHFLLVISPPECKLTDLDSKNGVFVNDVRYGGRKPSKTKVKQAPESVREVRLKDGDLITVGNTRIQVSLQAEQFSKGSIREAHPLPDLPFEQIFYSNGYQIIQKLSQTSKGPVYKVRDTETGKDVVIKMHWRWISCRVSKYSSCLINGCSLSDNSNPSGHSYSNSSALGNSQNRAEWRCAWD